MSETKFTPGPWEIYKGSIISQSERMIDLGTIAFMPETDGAEGIHQKQNAANARLIAQAPAMYALLKTIGGSVADQYDGGAYAALDYETWDTIGDVLAAVEGEGDG